jgi:hypothetical protein
MAPLHRSWLFGLLCSCLLPLSLSVAQAQPADPHKEAFPSRPQLSVHAGLLQPTVLRGFNAALDLRYRRLLVSYSHGAALDYSANPRLSLGSADREAGLSLRSPWSTGFGVGLTAIDQLYVMVDFKVHRYEARLDDQEARYTTISIGAELGYRWFVWRGLFVNPTLRYWPTVWSSRERMRLREGAQPFEHHAKDLGVFANVSIGIAFTP